MDNAAPLKTELERLQLREKEIEKLLSVTSHNLREPLRHVLSYTQLLQYELAADIKPEVHKDWSEIPAASMSRIGG